MQESFVDRLLNCVDCHSEFIFTAGEQLFFFDKQFKNDPKRCKPCKSRRSGLAAVANGLPAAAGISRTETRTQCSECGIETTVPFKPTQGRPVLCRQCFQLKSRTARTVQAPADAPFVDAVTPLPLAAQAADAASLVSLAAQDSGEILSHDAALVAAASMAAATPHSSVATPAELAAAQAVGADQASNAPVQSPADRTAELIAGTPAQLLENTQPPSELVAATVSESATA